MKKLVTCIAVAGLLMLGGSAIAELCSIEATPAATLLLPYFEVDLANDNGIDTFFSINNASAAPVLTHVVVWGDWSVEALDFNVYLTGYDVQSIGMGMMIRDGILPATAPKSTVSNLGDYSDGHGSYDACGALPYPEPALNDDYQEHLRAILTGNPSAFYGGYCGGEFWGDDIARGYVTVDVVQDCTLMTPCDEGYFTEAGDGIGQYDNVIWGDWYMIDGPNNFAQGDALVHIEAADPLDTIAVAQLENGTFYNRCNAPWGGIYYDYRESLATHFATRFFQNAVFDGGTDLIVWKDSQYPTADGYKCSAGPGWYPLPESQVIFFDEEENPETVCTISPCPQEDVLFPLETQRQSVMDLDVTPDSGWIYMNLNQNYGQGFAYLAQAWVVSIHSALGRFSAGLPAIQIQDFCDGISVLLGDPEDYPAEEMVCNWFTGEGCPVAREAKSW